MKKVKQVILVFFIGSIAALLLLEISLRIAGGSFQRGLESKTESPARKEENLYTILCLGNSYTEGSGAPEGESYPDQLQRLLDKEAKGKKIRVKNGGVGGQNSAELLELLEYNIKKTNPNLIILQTGQANRLNQYKYTTYLAREHGTSAIPKKFIFASNDFLYKSRVYRLAQLLTSNVKEKIKVSSQRKRDYVYFQFENKYREAIDWIHMMEHSPATGKERYIDPEKAEQLINLFSKHIKRIPKDTESYVRIGQVYLLQKKYAEAIKWFIKGIKASPSLGGVILNRNYRYFRRAYNESGDKELKKAADKFIREFSKSNPGYAEIFLFLTKDEICKWLESDIGEIIRIAQGKKIKVILQNYPATVRVDGFFNNVLLPKIAKDLNVYFVDNNRVFQELLDTGVKHEDLFVPDNHCNAKGYGVMAMNIFNKIKEERILELNE